MHVFDDGRLCLTRFIRCFIVTVVPTFGIGIMNKAAYEGSLMCSMQAVTQIVYGHLPRFRIFQHLLM